MSSAHGPNTMMVKVSTEGVLLHALFICTGNICRSPTAERLASEYATALQIAGFRASSAGTRAVIGSPMNESSAVVLRGLGGNPSNFSARQVTQRIVAEADFVLAMTRAHRDTVLGLAPNKLHRTFTLGEAAKLATEFDAQTIADLASLRSRLSGRVDTDIPDPIGRDLEVFERVGTLIAEQLPPVLELFARSA